jgi:subtilisin family serine protease
MPQRANSDPNASIVIYVHGIDQTRDAASLKVDWDCAIFGREIGERSRMAYWEDLVRELAPPSTPRGVIGEQAIGDASDRPPDIEGAIAAAGVSIEDSRVREFAEAMAARLAGAAAPALPGSFSGKFLPLPGVVRRPLARWAIEAFIRDTAAYFFKPGLREKIQQRLVDQLPRDGTPVLVVAHSQGSIIAYEVLSQLAANGIDLDALVTIGSPLGIQEVQDLLQPRPQQMPAVVHRWFNFATLLDPVALDKGLADEYPPQGDSEPVHDELVSNTSWNPHSAVGYLASPRVRNLIRDEMRIDAFAPFVLARDVAEKLAEPEWERHSVLIEAVEPGFTAHYEQPDDMRSLELHERRGAAITLKGRIADTAELLRTMVVTDEHAAQIDPLKRFISAKLTAGELRLVAQLYQELRVYSVWRSTRKAKLTGRSMRVLKADAALASFDAGGQDITWAVLDTGVRGDHPHFLDANGNSLIDAVWDCTRRGAPRRIDVAAARDPDGHGTHVSGIITGHAPPGHASKQRGAAPSAKIVMYKVLDDRGQGEDAWIIKALDHIAEQNENKSDGLAIHGVNLSLGGPFDTTVYGCGFSPICVELRRLWRAGVLVVVACGNEGRIAVRTPDGDTEISSPMSIGDPANLEDCIAVGSVNADQPHLYGISSFSSRGPTSDGRAKPDCVAPGERISSANSRFRSQRDLYYEESGTSMAAPHVSGLLAAFLSVRREYRGRPDEVKKILAQSCVDLGRDRYHQGAGVPNLMQMLMVA